MTPDQQVRRALFDNLPRGWAIATPATDTDNFQPVVATSIVRTVRVFHVYRLFDKVTLLATWAEDARAFHAVTLSIAHEVITLTGRSVYGFVTFEVQLRSESIFDDGFWSSALAAIERKRREEQIPF
jgi:hypothetical protein